MTVAAPWMFGCTEDWARRWMHWGALAMAAALAGKVAIRVSFGYSPPRWTAYPGVRRLPLIVLGVLTAAMLAYVSASYFNGSYRLTYNARIGPELVDTGHRVSSWLPSSFDIVQTGSALPDYFAFAAVFWSARDWFLGKTRRERRAEEDERNAAQIPARLALWLWVICVNGALVGLIATLQRLDHSDRLLWLVDPYYQGDTTNTFGPYAYRTNAAQYFNLIFPLAVGFWWSLRAEDRDSSGPGRRRGSKPHVVLLPCLIWIGASTFISTSRGGAMVLAGLLVAASAVLVFSNRGDRAAAMVLALVAACSLGLGAFLGGAQLSKRFETAIADRMNGRLEIYTVARRMAEDYPWWGSGPGTFKSLYGFYRPNLDATWAGYAHNDWLETLVTFGRIGSAMILAAMLALGFVASAGVGIALPREFTSMALLGLLGMMLHAVFDFPFQVYSLTFTFVIILAAISIRGKDGHRAE
jgi:O-antigen ligase